MTNEYGLNVNYYTKKLKNVLQDKYYTLDEMFNELSRLANTAKQTEMRDEYNNRKS